MQVQKSLTRSVFCFLVIFVAAAPHSIAAAQIAYSGALLFWVVNWILGYWRPVSQPLVLPSLVFIVLSTVSAALSFAPSISWAHLKSVSLLLIFVLIAQNLNSFRQLRTLATVLVASCMINVAYTGWQYTAGVGVKVVPVTKESSLSQMGLETGDMIHALGGHRVQEPDDLLHAIGGLSSGSSAQLSVLRGQPLHRFKFQASSAALRNLSQEVAQGQILLSRGHPIRAQGFYDHYVTYADVLVQIGLLAFGLFLVCPAAKYRQKILIAVAVSLMGAALWLTLTRAAMVSFLAGCLLALWLVHGWKVSLLVLPAVAILAMVGGSLIHKERGLTWIDLKSPEAQYRLLMWKDGVRLIRKHPFFGVGMDSIKVEWHAWNIQAYERFPLHSHFHSTPIQIAVERGLLTFAAWIWLLAAYFRLLWNNLKRARHSDWVRRGLALGCAIAAFGFLLGSLVDYSWGDSEVIMIFWTLMGFAVVLNRLLIAAVNPSETAPSGQA
jgi:O-Antigen ligase/PDZ domain